MLAAWLGDSSALGCLADYRGDLVKLAIGGNRQIAFALCHMYDWGLGVYESGADLGINCMGP